MTSQVVARYARPELMISHAPGFMFVRDVVAVEAAVAAGTGGAAANEVCTIIT